MRFETDQFRIGESEYGSWAFTLTPTGIGAEFHDVNFDFRGLRLGRDSLDDSIDFWSRTSAGSTTGSSTEVNSPAFWSLMTSVVCWKLTAMLRVLKVIGLCS